MADAGGATSVAARSPAASGAAAPDAVCSGAVGDLPGAASPGGRPAASVASPGPGAVASPGPGAAGAQQAGRAAPGAPISAPATAAAARENILGIHPALDYGSDEVITSCFCDGWRTVGGIETAGSLPPASPQMGGCGSAAGKQNPPGTTAVMLSARVVSLPALSVSHDVAASSPSCTRAGALRRNARTWRRWRRCCCCGATLERHAWRNPPWRPATPASARCCRSSVHALPSCLCALAAFLL